MRVQPRPSEVQAIRLESGATIRIVPLRNGLFSFQLTQADGKSADTVVTEETLREIQAEFRRPRGGTAR